VGSPVGGVRGFCVTSYAEGRQCSLALWFGYKKIGAFGSLFLRSFTFKFVSYLTSCYLVHWRSSLAIGIVFTKH
jgi:hypothetical protein